MLASELEINENSGKISKVKAFTILVSNGVGLAFWREDNHIKVARSCGGSFWWYEFSFELGKATTIINILIQLVNLGGEVDEISNSKV